MPKFTMDTDKIKAAGEELKEIAKEYNKIVNELYSNINNINKNGTWNSDSDQGSANQFINAVNKDKESIQSLGSSTKQLGSKVIEFANSINSTTDNKI